MSYYTVKRVSVNTWQEVPTCHPLDHSSSMPAARHPFPNLFLSLQIWTEILRKIPWISKEILVLVEMYSFRHLSRHLIRLLKIIGDLRITGNTAVYQFLHFLHCLVHWCHHCAGWYLAPVMIELQEGNDFSINVCQMSYIIMYFAAIFPYDSPGQ